MNGPRPRRAVGRWLAAWVGGAVLGIANYNLARGRTWPLVLAWIAIGPAAMARVATKRPDAR
jgi:hypothetical protein